MTYLRNVGKRTSETPQDQPIIGRETEMSQNNAGGFTFTVDEWTRLHRFLILGSEGNTYYQTERELTRANAKSVEAAIKLDGERVVRTVVEISQGGRAPKNDPALFVLALCASIGNDATRRAAFKALPDVARIGTHLFQFVGYALSFRGWGRGLRTAVANWYERRDPASLAYQMVKYQRRNDWSHSDLLRLTHPKAATTTKNWLYKWAVDGDQESVKADLTASGVLEGELKLLDGFMQLRSLGTEVTDKNEREAAKIIRKFRLPFEAVPSHYLGSKIVWEALVEEMPMTALIRNLGRLTANGLLSPTSKNVKYVTDQLGDADHLHSARVHPMQLLIAQRTYNQGHGEKGKLTWKPITKIIDALDDAFYASFPNVESTGKQLLLALDVSGSMGWGDIAGAPGLTPREASAAMALITAATEPNTVIVGFTAGPSRSGRGPSYSVDNTALTTIDISPKMRLNDAIKKVSDLEFGATDCSLPMLWAKEQKAKFDGIVIFTDNETWAGKIQPAEALRDYRRALSPEARLAVEAFTATEFSIADPKDAGMLDVVGFDTATPQMLRDFWLGKI